MRPGCAILSLRRPGTRAAYIKATFASVNTKCVRWGPHQSLKAASMYVTHDQLEATTLAGRIICLVDGRFCAGGHTARPVFLRPPCQCLRGRVHPLTTMNILPATLSIDADRPTFVPHRRRQDRVPSGNGPAARSLWARAYHLRLKITYPRARGTLARATGAALRPREACSLL